MPDYVGILKRSIDALPDRDPVMRQAVYERARSALARQLTGIDPPLSADEIEVQHQHLEDAITAVESELAAEDAEVEESAGEAEEAQPPATEAPPTAAAAPRSAPPPPAAAPVAGEPQADDDETEPEAALDPDAAAARPSRAPLIVMLALLALVAVGAGALAYTNWPTVETVYADLRGQLFGGEPATPPEPAPQVAAVEPGGPAAPPEPAEAASPAAPPAPADAARPKSEDRLPSEPGIAEAPAAPPAAPEEREQAALDPGAADDTTTGAAGVATDRGEAAIPAPAPSAPRDDPAAGLVVAQRAIFYEQGEEGGSGRATQGAVAWERLQRPQQAPAIAARIDLPQQGVEVTLTFTRNADPALPASHLIEVALDGDGTLGSTPIQRVPALVLKPNEQARGQALAGAAVPVTERLFWIALSDDPEQVGRNISLLRDGSWFDMPILFEDGQRALLTFEKGIPGDRVFETVLAEWAEAQQRTQR